MKKLIVIFVALALFTILVITLIILVPQLLRAHLRKVEMQHAEHMRALERGLAVPPEDEPSRAAGRTAMLVPMVVMIAAGTVTCFIAAYKTEEVFAVALAIWSVAGIVSLPGMMTGQIVSGIAPEQAVRYQIVILYQLVAVAAVAGAVARVAKSIWVRRAGRGLGFVLKPVQFVRVGVILAAIDAATFLGWVQALCVRPPRRNAINPESPRAAAATLAAPEVRSLP